MLTTTLLVHFPTTLECKVVPQLLERLDQIVISLKVTITLHESISMIKHSSILGCALEMRSSCATGNLVPHKISYYVE